MAARDIPASPEAGPAQPSCGPMEPFQRGHMLVQSRLTNTSRNTNPSIIPAQDFRLGSWEYVVESQAARGAVGRARLGNRAAQSTAPAYPGFWWQHPQQQSRVILQGE